MYFNDVNIIYYIIISILGLFSGELVNWLNKRLPDEKPVFTKGALKEYKEQFKPNYVLMLLMALIYVAILYKFGIKETFIENIDLIKFLILAPMLLSAFIIDYRLQIIPNRLNLTIFEVGLVFAFIHGLSNVAISINLVLGMIAGAGIFLAITLVGGLIYGKEAMGFGDVKLMGALGLYFGLANIIIITLVSFLVGAILSIILLATKIRSVDQYIPFGPFIVLAAFIAIFIPYETITMILLNIFTLGLYSRK